MSENLEVLQELRGHFEKRNFLSVHRERAEENTIDGYLIGLSDELALLHELNDFRPNGLRLVRCCDITGITREGTHTFHGRLLQEQGVFDQVDFDHSFPADSLPAFLAAIPEREILIIENELAEEPDFFIGRIAELADTYLHGDYFNGEGEWDDEATEIDYEDITSVQIRSGYINLYARHFEQA